MNKEARTVTAIGIHKHISERETSINGLDLFSLKAMLDKLENKREAIK